MKLFQTILVALLVTGTAMAQGPQHSSHKSTGSLKTAAMHKNFLAMVMGRQLVNAQRSTGTQQRILAESTYQADSTGAHITDSVQHYYPSNAGGSKYDYSQMAYNNSYDPYSSPIFPADPQSTNSLDVFNDSMRRWEDQGLGSLSDALVQYFTFNSSRQVNVFSQEQFYLGNKEKMVCAYNGQGKLSSVVKLYASGAGWDTSGKRIFHYDAAGRISRDTLFNYSANAGVWTVNVATNYSYDAAGNVIKIIGDLYNVGSNTWTTMNRLTADYDAANQIKSIVLEEDMGNGLDSVSRDTFGYAGNNAINTYWRTDNNTGTGLLPTSLVIRHINPANQLPDSTFEYSYDDDEPLLQSLALLTYNIYNNPETLKKYDMLNGVFTINTIQYYYYELYEDLAVNNTPSVKADINVYPNPGKDVINIRWNEFKQGNVVEVSIVNAAGQIVRKEQMNWMQQTETISINNLQPGIYWICLNDASGKVFSQSFLKQ